LTACALVALIAPRSPAQEAPADEGASSDATAAPQDAPTLDQVQAMHSLWCETLDKAKRAQRKADAYQSSASTMPPGIGQLTAQENASQARSEADTNFVEAGKLKKRVAELVEQFCAAQQAVLDGETDEDQRKRIEEQIALAQQLANEGCS